MTEITLLNTSTNKTKTWASMKECAIDLGCSPQNVGFLFNGKSNTIMNGLWVLPNRRNRRKTAKQLRTKKNYICIPVILEPVDFPYENPITEGNKKTLMDFICGRSLKYLTSKKSLGYLTGLVRDSNCENFKDFFNTEYLPVYGSKYFKARETFLNKIREQREVKEEWIPTDHIREFFEHAGVFHAWGGVRDGDIAIKAVASLLNTTYEYASSEIDTKGIDAFIGGLPVQVKSIKGASWGYDSDMYIYYDVNTNLVWFNKKYFSKFMNMK